MIRHGMFNVHGQGDSIHLNLLHGTIIEKITKKELKAKA